MLDIEQTRERFLDWVKSRAFNPHLDARFKVPKWPFIAAAIAILCIYLFQESRLLLPAIIAAGFFLFRGWRLWHTTRIERKKFRQSLHLHEPIVCSLIIGNRNLFNIKGAVAPALLIGSFGPQDDGTVERVLAAAEVFASLYGTDPLAAPPELQEACRMVNDDTYRPDRRRQVPASIPGHNGLWLFDTMLLADDFPSGQLDSPFLACMASPGHTGTIIQLPPSVPVFKDTNYNPNIIQHSARTTPPPIVAPHADNLEAVENHISRHLGDPATVFHELISTTVHIDVHFVRPTPERPWVSLVTSGMSDIPMTVPAGAEQFRFAELMIRLPADWQLSDEAFKQEENYWPIRNLKFLARFVHEYETWLSFGHTIPNGNPPEPFAPGIPFTGTILSPPWIGGDELATLHLPDGTAVHFWSLIPLHSSEMDFKLAHGADALFERLTAAGHSDLFNPARPAVA